NFLGVALIDKIKETFAELVADPVFEVARIAHRHKARFQPRQNAEDGFEGAEFDQGFERAERVGKKFATVKNARPARPIQHVLRQNLVPKLVYFFRLREKAITADVKLKTSVGGGAGNPADVHRIGCQNGGADRVPGQKGRAGQ